MALDVARILLRPTTELAMTDIASHALAALEQSNIRFPSCKYVVSYETHTLASIAVDKFSKYY